MHPIKEVDWLWWAGRRPSDREREHCAWWQQDALPQQREWIKLPASFTMMSRWMVSHLPLSADAAWYTFHPFIGMVADYRSLVDRFQGRGKTRQGCPSLCGERNIENEDNVPVEFDLKNARRWLPCRQQLVQSCINIIKICTGNSLCLRFRVACRGVDLWTLPRTLENEVQPDHKEQDFGFIFFP